MTAQLLTPELDLEREGDITMLARVETKIKQPQDISWCSEMELAIKSDQYTDPREHDR